MKIGVYSTKGGVGKSSIAFSLAKDLNMNLITNDMSDYLRKYNKAKFQSKPILKENTIYDFGGFKDKYISSFSMNLDIILIPLLNDINSLIRGIEAGKKFKDKKVIFIGNAIETKKDIDQISLVMNKYFNSPNLIFIRKTNLLKVAMESGISANQFAKSKKYSHVYKNILKDYQNLLSILNNI
jgi:cellulose biosynthesis protein BcsQ